MWCVCVCACVCACLACVRVLCVLRVCVSCVCGSRVSYLVSIVCDTLQVIIYTCVYESFYYLYYDPEILSQNASSMRFSHIASLHSELIAVSVDGKLHQWKWSDPMPLRSTPGHHSHSRASDMKLKDEKIIALDACNVRASVMTESGKVCMYVYVCI